MSVQNQNATPLSGQQCYDHGAMPFPAYKILKDHIKRLTEKK